MQSYVLNWIRDMRADQQAQKDLAFTIVLGLVCLTIGYFIGEVSSGGLFDSSAANLDEAPRTKKSWPNSYDVTVHADSSDEEAGADGDEEDGDEDGDGDGDGRELKSFEDTIDEVKLVLVVRTDLNMGKGMRCPFHTVWTNTTNSVSCRQNRCASLPCHSGLLQIPAQPCPFCCASEAMGEGWSGKDCCTSENRGRATNAASSSYESRTMCKDHSGCRKNTDCSRQHDRARHTRT